jgi:hypothetical protein
VGWGKLRVKQAPYRVPPVFAGGRILVYGFVEKIPDENAIDVSLDMEGPRGPLSYKVAVPFGRRSKGSLIARLGAQTMLRDLEEGASALHGRRGSLQKRSHNDRVKEEAVRLGVTYGLCSRWTSFVAVEKREKPLEGELQLRKVPVALTRGWGGMEERLFSARMVPPQAAAPYPIVRTLALSPLARLKDMLKPASSEQSTSVRGLELDLAGVGEAPAASVTPAMRPLDRLVALQRADGSWDLGEELAKLMGKRLDELESKLADVTGDPEQAERAWATALALVWLKVKASQWKEEWALLDRKARRWLAQCPAKLDSGEAWLDAASQLIN